MITGTLGRGFIGPTLAAGGHAFALLFAALVLIGCSDARNPEQETPSSGAAAEFNEADVTFARAMIPHGEQGADMSEIVLKVKGLDPAVRTLAIELARNRQAETTQLERWVAARGEPVAAEGPGHSHGGGEDGIATPTQMSELRYAKGAAAQILYVQMMTKHHGGAVAAAHEEIAHGQSPESVEFARMVLRTREAQLPVLVYAARATPAAPTPTST